MKIQYGLFVSAYHVGQSGRRNNFQLLMTFYKDIHKTSFIVMQILLIGCGIDVGIPILIFEAKHELKVFGDKTCCDRSIWFFWKMVIRFDIFAIEDTG